MLAITSDFPLPKPRTFWRSELDKLEVGDSFDFEGTDKEIAHFRVSVFRAGISIGKTFTVRSDGFMGVRCWRTA